MADGDAGEVVHVPLHLPKPSQNAGKSELALTKATRAHSTVFIVIIVTQVPPTPKDSDQLQWFTHSTAQSNGTNYVKEKTPHKL